LPVLGSFGEQSVPVVFGELQHHHGVHENLRVGVPAITGEPLRDVSNVRSVADRIGPPLAESLVSWMDAVEPFAC
jgi:hypothetical protein